MIRTFIVCVGMLLFSQCGIYSFSGSTLPGHVRSVSIPLFENRTMEPGISDELTNLIRQAYISNNTLRVQEKDADASLTVTLLSYKSEPQNFDAAGNVRDYRVILRAAAVFRDDKKNEDLWREDNITCQGTYSAENPRETEAQGKERAIQELSNILIENTISGW